MAKYDSVHISKGVLLGMGVSGIVEKPLDSAYVIKTPCPGEDYDQCRKDLDLERRVYELLGNHPRLLKFYGQDEGDGSIKLEYALNGTLRDYIAEHQPSMDERLRFATEITEGLAVLHESGVVHCDLSPRNVLVDAEIGLRIADFSSASIDGSPSSAGGSVRFQIPRNNPWKPTYQDDIFSLGSTLFEVMTSAGPYDGLESSMVIERFRSKQFPDSKGVILGDIIQKCWNLHYSSLSDVLPALQKAVDLGDQNQST
ncbi:kinase-like protein [Aaosphaeria arxii CBS 175.79]|uniref:EKC/KEOPS complex subunit BUD32 n=1 Tax=Aaosphaeria arxii CBS 175.79 TaxID=1450172 RepID=A0A6A5XLC7_9PLEO|nr:kinase-like protein [Aaosphaeria arxii CBS 175.79]KAF2013550.1 kinase-like protein [Aaosphaeria arxii CBS 175.79]